jgi:hypothetical protein
MMRIWDEYGDETDASIALRSFAVWALQTAAMVAELLILKFAPHRAPWPWLGVALLAPVIYVLAVLAFFATPRRDRLMSAAKCTGQAAALLAVLAWIFSDNGRLLGWICLGLMSLIIGLRMWHGYRGERAGERAARDRLTD